MKQNSWLKELKADCAELGIKDIDWIDDVKKDCIRRGIQDAGWTARDVFERKADCIRKARRILSDAVPVVKQMADGYRCQSVDKDVGVVRVIYGIFRTAGGNNNLDFTDVLLESGKELRFYKDYNTLPEQIECFLSDTVKVLEELAAGRKVWFAKHCVGCLSFPSEEIEQVDDRIFWTSDRRSLAVSNIKVMSKKYKPWETIDDAAPYLRHFFRKMNHSDVAFLVSCVQDNTICFGMNRTFLGERPHADFPLTLHVGEMENWEHSEDINGQWKECRIEL